MGHWLGMWVSIRTKFYYLRAHSSKLPQFPYGVLGSNDPGTATLIFPNVRLSPSSEH